MKPVLSMPKNLQFSVTATIFLFTGMDSSMTMLYFYLKTKLEKHDLSVIRIYRWFGKHWWSPFDCFGGLSAHKFIFLQFAWKWLEEIKIFVLTMNSSLEGLKYDPAHIGSNIEGHIESHNESHIERQIETHIESHIETHIKTYI